MNIETAKAALGNICRKHKGYEALHKVAIKDGFAYATDGRIAMRVRVQTIDGDCDASHDSVPEDYPIDSLDTYMKNLPSHGWRRIAVDGDNWRRLTTKLENTVKRKRNEAERERHDRYVMERCPCCGEYVYYDKEEERLVEEQDIEEAENIDWRDVDIPVEVDLGNETVFVNFGFLWEAKQILGGIEVCKGGDRMIGIRLGDGIGVIATLRAEEIDGDGANGIFCLETEDVATQEGESS